MAEAPNLQVKLRDVPHKPGVYVMRDRLKRVIYVGKARDLRKRLANYFTPSRQMRADLKTRALLESIWDFEYHLVRSDAEAVLYEGRLIKDFRPKYNISFRDDKRFLLVKVDEREEWPRYHLTRIKKDDGARYFGPFADAGALRQTLTFMRKKFGVMTFGRGSPSERERKSSTYQVPMKLADITAEEYRERIARSVEFLAGESKELINHLETEMKAAAGKLDFERAAELRNLLDSLKQTTKSMTRFTRKSLPSAINPEDDLAALGDALGLHRPPITMECFDISNISNTHIVASMVRFKNGVPDRANYRRYRIRGTPNQDDFASMAEVVRRRYSRVLRESPQADEYSQESPTSNIQLTTLPDLIIVDGGKGQLSSACKELQRLNLYDVPIIGLAKEFEEIYRPGRPLPLILPEDSGALKLLQRIRDEAHRFANGYHSLLLKKRISESVLDDIPGVSESRKKALLTKFGSTERIKRSSVEDIASVPGISTRLGEQIVEYLTRDPSQGKFSKRPSATDAESPSDEHGPA